MSYDLMVFDPSAAPLDRMSFLNWFEEQTKWEEDHGYNDPSVCAPGLEPWFEEMRATFPPMNGPLASEDFDDPRVSDYSIGRCIIYVTFAWSEAQIAYERTFELARKHGVGFFDVSSNDGSVWAPNDRGDYTRLHGSSTGPEEAIAAFESVVAKLERGE